MSLRLRLFWLAYGLVSLFFVALWAGPSVESAVAPIRDMPGAIEEVHRDGGYLRFTWVSTKRRMAPSPGVDVTMEAAKDIFDLSLFNDVGAPAEPPCTKLMPWGRSQTVGIGEHRHHLCVQIPITVKALDPIELRVVAKYRGLWGLWTLFVPLPPIKDPQP